MPRTRRYTIEIKEAETGAIVIFTAADWTDKERRHVVALILQLAGLPDNTFSASGVPAPKRPGR